VGRHIIQIVQRGGNIVVHGLCGDIFKLLS